MFTCMKERSPMNKKYHLKVLWLALMLVMSTDSQYNNKKEELIDVHAQNADLNKVIAIIREKSNLNIVVGSFPEKNISYYRQKISPIKALQDLSELSGVPFSVKGSTILFGVKSASRAIASAQALAVRAYRIPIVYMSTSTAEQKVKEIFGAKLKISTDSKSDTLIYYGDFKTKEKILELIDQIDVAPKQVLIEARIVEVTQSFARDFSVSLERILTRSINAGPKDVVFSNPPDAGNLTFDYRLGVLDGDVVDVAIRAAESTGDAKVISRPKIVTDDQQEAEINSGITFNVKTLASSSGESDEEGASGLVQVNAGLNLKVKPTVTRKNNLRMEISIEKSEVDQGSSVDGIPGITNSSASTSVVVGDGQTAAIGGIIKHTKGHNVVGVPLLKNLPLIGFLFRGSTRSETDQELMIFITPKIL